MRSSAYLLTAAAAAGILVAGCNNNSARGGGSGGGRVLATVNGENVTTEQLMDVLQVKPRIRVLVNDQGAQVDPNGVAELQVADNIAFQGFQDLISETLLLQEAKEQKLLPTEKEVAEEIEFRTKLTANYVQELQNQGFTMAQIRSNLKTELARERLLTRGTTVTMAEVDEFIKANPSQFIQPARAAFDVLNVKTEAEKAAAQKELDAGTSFEKVKTKYDKSTDQQRNEVAVASSGEGVPMETLNDQIRPQVEKTKPGMTTDWIKSQNTWIKLKVLSKKDKSNVEMTEARKKFLQRQMAMNKGSKANDLRALVEKKLRSAKIDLKDEGLKKLWTIFEQRLKEMPATPAPAPANTTAGTTGG